MREQRFTATDKKVQKITKEGLVEENLAKQTKERISKRLEDADFTKQDKPMESSPENKKGEKEQPHSRSPSGKRRRLRFTSEESVAADNDSSCKFAVADGKKANEAKQNRKKVARKKLYEEKQKQKKAKLRFDDEANGGTGSHSSGISGALAIKRTVEKMQEEPEQDDNSGTEALQTGKRTAGHVYRFTSSRAANRKNKRYERTHKLNERSRVELHYQEHLKRDESLQNASTLKRFWQKQRIKREYVKAYRAEKYGGAAAKSGVAFFKDKGRKVLTFFAEHKGIALSIAALILLLLIIMGSVSSCSMGAVQIISTTMASSYLSEPEEIEKAELYYTELEAALQKKINAMESEHPGLDEYRYNIGEINHDPHVLISFLSAKYETFTFEQVKGEIEALFEAQYGIKVEQVKEIKKETKTVQVGESLGKVVTSGYCSCPICCGVWSGGPTASGVMPKGNHTIAVDAKNPIVPMGTKIVMTGVEYTVEDTGNFARYGVAFDVYYDNHAAASNHGHRTWEAYLAEGNANMVEVITTQTVEVLNVTLTAKPLRSAIFSRMNEEQKELYELIYSARGNLQVYQSPVDLNWYSYIKSYYGYRINPETGKRELHRGIEVSVPEGTEVQSGQTGTVAAAGYDNQYGHYVVTEDEKGYQLKYGHLQELHVSQGQSITMGDVIGKTGSTGNVSGSQLYLELVKDGAYYNPIFYVDTGGGDFGGGASYDDETVRRLFEEAEKYLGMPYVWGGSSPATSFDCSGFVSYVFTHSGVCNMGRLTAQGIYDICDPVDPSEAKPGDIIFFTGTYNAGVPVSHVGIYAGDGMMIHCGNPIQYTSIYSPYWQQHFYAFGRPKS